MRLPVKMKSARLARKEKGFFFFKVKNGSGVPPNEKNYSNVCVSIRFLDTTLSFFKPKET